MQELQDIFSIWPSTKDLAVDIGREPDTVLRWKLRGRIPEDAWSAIIEKAAMREVLVTAAQLLALNRPVKPRGRPKATVASA